MTSDLHRGFHDPRQGAADELMRFLEETDRLPSMRPVREAMREAIGPRPGLRLLDAGCGVGLETARLAADHPEMQVTGLDRNAELLEIARERAPGVEWIEADITDLDLDAEFDAIRTERVLIHVPDVEAAVDNLLDVLAPDGRLALFELDYGGTILAPGPDEEIAGRVAETLYGSMEQPQAGRRLPGLLADRGLTDVAATPFAFSINDQIFERIVKNTVIAESPDPEVEEWLEQQEEAAADGAFVAAFTGVLTAATRP